MEGANESGRASRQRDPRGVRSSASPAAIYQLHRPPEWEALKLVDQQMYRLGLKNAFDVG